jgi:low temperature requirement protein LtrA
MVAMEVGATSGGGETAATTSSLQASPSPISLKIPVDLAGWLELFVDLVFVAATLIFSLASAELHSGLAKVWIEAMFGLIWWIWLSTTVLMNRYRLSSWPARILLLVQMYLVVIFAMEARAGIDHEIRLLCLSYAGLLATVALLWLLAGAAAGEGRSFALRLAGCNLAAAALFAVAAPGPDGLRYALGALGLVVVLLPTLWPRLLATSRPRYDTAHLIERLGAFSLIMMGETFIDIAVEVERHRLGPHDSATLAFQFLLVFALWGAYFEDIPQAGLNRRRISPWLLFHFSLQLSIVVLGIGISSILRVPAGAHLPDRDAIEILVMMAVFFASLIGLNHCSERRPLRGLTTLRGASVGAVALLALASWFLPWLHLDDVAVVAVLIAVLNLALAPSLLAKTSVALEAG